MKLVVIIKLMTDIRIYYYWKWRSTKEFQTCVRTFTICPSFNCGPISNRGAIEKSELNKIRRRAML